MKSAWTHIFVRKNAKGNVQVPVTSKRAYEFISESKESEKTKLEAMKLFEKFKALFPDASTQEIIFRLIHEDETIHVCSNCNTQVKFVSFNKGFLQYCSRSCCARAEIAKNRRKQTCMERYGVDVPSKLENIREKMKSTMKERYGVENPSQCIKFQQKKKETSLLRYGAEHYSKTTEFTNRIKQTSIHLYGKENYAQTAECREKMKSTMKERYGVEYALQREISREKMKSTMKERYGVENYSKTDEYVEKVKQTNLKKYGKEFYTQTEEYKNRIHEKCEEINKKCYETKKKNKSFNKSKAELIIYQKLCTKFSEVKTQYRSDMYPWACDFYIPEKDLYIEFQGIWTHGNTPFDSCKIEHQQIVQRWREKSNKTNFKGKTKSMYTNAIQIWTVKDPEKRAKVEENKLNWIEFFNLEDFEKWFVNLD